MQTGGEKKLTEIESTPVGLAFCSSAEIKATGRFEEQCPGDTVGHFGG
jgi:hypothetical protein